MSQYKRATVDPEAYGRHYQAERTRWMIDTLSKATPETLTRGGES